MPLEPGQILAADHRSSHQRLVGAITDLASARSIEEVREIVRTAARALTGADGATFVLRDGDHCYYVDEDAIAPLWRGSRFPMGSCISGWAMLHRHAVVIDDIYADDRIPHEAYRPTFVRSLVMVPVRTADPVAAIGNYWAEPHHATDDEVSLLQALADSTAVALENVRVLEHLEHAVETRTAELRAANDDMRHLAATMAHDVAVPLTAVTGFASLLLERLDGADPAAREMAEAIERNGMHAGELIHQLLDYARSGVIEARVERIDVDRLVRDVLGGLDLRRQERGVMVEIGPLADVRADPSLLGQVLQNLLGNAIAYAASTVSVAATDHGGWWELRVVDDGPGIPDAEKSAVFEPFERGSRADQPPGSGLGLAICHRIVQRHGGEIAVRDACGGGAELVVSLPA